MSIARSSVVAALEGNYNHKTREKHWQQHWLDAGTYHWDESATREDTYVIDTPPPTVSGTLHMGHVFSYTQADFIARFQRMNGKTVFYPMGFDDNGLPTERLVEKVKKVRATDMSREAFIELCEGVAEEARIEFRSLFSSTALSVDWRQEYSTISADSRRISQMSFLDLFKKDRAYRQLQPMLWDPVDQTAIAQAEVEDKELPSHFSDIRFGVLSPYHDELESYIVIGTTRPEMIPACVAIFYHPDDARYQPLKGKFAITPLFGVRVPILEDDTVEPDKGTGIMMCCTFGDEKDIEKWRKHKLETKIILNKYGKLNFEVIEHSETKEVCVRSKMDQDFGGKIITTHDDFSLMRENTLVANDVVEQLNGLKVVNARAKILELLNESDSLGDSKPIVHAVKCAERSGAPLEILPTQQWFVKLLDQKEQLKAKSAECNWYPPYMKIRMDQWIDGLNWDWCISRQRYFGVPFPVWYVQGNEIIVARPEDLPVNPLVDVPYGYEKLEQLEGLSYRARHIESGREVVITPEADVMDTWATSSVSPQLSSRGISTEFAVDAKRHSQLFPADLRPQAHEIIRTWAFYTLVKAHLHENTIPWKNLMISGWCLAADKTKMSKSKGNVVTPVALIEEKGTDAVRYWASTSRLGSDTAFSEDLLKIGNKLVNKLWNASKFASMQLVHLKGEPTTAEADIRAGVITETLDKWIVSRLQKTIAKATTAFAEYEYCDARVAAEDFFWNDFCDNYLELVKARAYGQFGEAAQQSACTTIYHCLDAILRLFAPFVPHITEEIFATLYPQHYAAAGSLHARGMWAKAADFVVDETAEQAGIATVALLEVVRKAKSERNVSIKVPLAQMVVSKAGEVESSVWTVLPSVADDLKSATSAQAVVFADAPAQDEIVMQSDDACYSVAMRLTSQESAA
jgi:valyl-tRNA synthetase